MCPWQQKSQYKAKISVPYIFILPTPGAGEVSEGWKTHRWTYSPSLVTLLSSKLSDFALFVKCSYYFITYKAGMHMMQVITLLFYGYKCLQVLVIDGSFRLFWKWSKSMNILHNFTLPQLARSSMHSEHWCWWHTLSGWILSGGTQTCHQSVQ